MNGRHVATDAPKALRLDPRYGTYIKTISSMKALEVSYPHMPMAISFILVETTLMTSSKLCNAMEKQQVIGTRRTTWTETYPSIELWFLVTPVKHRQLLKLIMLPSRGRESSIQLLGVTLDERLNFSGHISQICAKTTRRINVISRVRKLIPLQAKLQILLFFHI